MAEQKGRQHVLQNALASGLSATEGYHSSKPNKVDPQFDGQQLILPSSFVPKATDRFKIRAKSGDISASYLSIGAWAWGDEGTWQWSDSERAGLTEAWKQLFSAGVNYIDTAQAYGSGESERITGELIRGLPRDEVVIQTKYYVVPDNPTNIFTPSSAPVKFLRQSLERMGLQYVDVYMIHGHIHAGSIKQVAKGAAECVEEGLTRAIAVANYSVEDMLDMKKALAEYGVPLAMNQCEFSIIRRLPEVEGMLTACRENDIVFQSYSSIAQGRLSGKWNKDSEPPKSRRFSSYSMADLEETLSVVKSIAEKHGVSMPAVALNYNIGKGVIPVVGVRKPEQSRDNLQALGWRLSDEEYKQIDAVSIEGKHSKLWQQG